MSKNRKNYVKKYLQFSLFNYEIKAKNILIFVSVGLSIVKSQPRRSKSPCVSFYTQFDIGSIIIFFFFLGLRIENRPVFIDLQRFTTFLAADILYDDSILVPLYYTMYTPPSWVIKSNYIHIQEQNSYHNRLSRDDVYILLEINI